MSTVERRNTRPRTRAITRSQIRELEADLRGEGARLERSLAAGIGAEGAIPFVSAGRGNVPGGTQDQLGVGFQSRAHARHGAIVEALRRIAEGTYGRCAVCRDPIPFGRLLVMPEVEHCVACGPRA